MGGPARSRLLVEGHPPDRSTILSELQSRVTPHRIKRRADFLRAAAGKRFHGKAFTLQMAQRRIPAGPAGAGEQDPSRISTEPPRFGFTVTKKIGKAVLRNRIRRRLKEAVRTLDPLPARAGHDYVMIARADAVGAALTALQGELVRALGKIDAGKTRAAGSPRHAQHPEAASINSGSRRAPGRGAGAS